MLWSNWKKCYNFYEHIGMNHLIVDSLHIVLLHTSIIFALRFEMRFNLSIDERKFAYRHTIIWV